MSSHKKKSRDKFGFYFTNIKIRETTFHRDFLYGGPLSICQEVNEHEDPSKPSSESFSLDSLEASGIVPTIPFGIQHSNDGSPIHSAPNELLYMSLFKLLEEKTPYKILANRTIRKSLSVPELMVVEYCKSKTHIPSKEFSSRILETFRKGVEK